eukprot:scaffold38846_cov197-Isochrysis_galbana.AAC.2
MAGLSLAVSSSSSSKALAGACSGIVKRKLAAPSGTTGGPLSGARAGLFAMAQDDGLAKLEAPASQNTKDQRGAQRHRPLRLAGRRKTLRDDFGSLKTCVVDSDHSRVSSKLSELSQVDLGPPH